MSQITRYNRARLEDRQLTELIGIARGLIADGHLHDLEIDFLHRWLVANSAVTPSPMLSILLDRIEAILSDGIIDPEERAEVFEALQSLTGPVMELGETLKSTSLPLCSPAPTVEFFDLRFTFTGTFAFGSRQECEDAVRERDGHAGSLRRDTAYLVIGEYASDDWVHSSYGRKIEQAVKMRSEGVSIAIISEDHWTRAISQWSDPL